MGNVVVPRRRSISSLVVEVDLEVFNDSARIVYE